MGPSAFATLVALRHRRDRCLGLKEKTEFRGRISDQKRAEELLQRMCITLKKWNGPLLVQRFMAEATAHFAKALGQNDYCDQRADKSGGRNGRRRQVYRSISFVIGGFREVALGDC
jgi:hypothetical protein